MLLRFSLYMVFICACGFILPAHAEIDPLFNFSKKYEQALVVKVTNSDALILEDGRRIKLIGVESAGLPEKKYAERDKNGMIIEEPEQPDISLEEQAITYAQDLMEGKKVRLEFDVESIDRDGKQLAYVFLADGRLANAEMLRQGFVYLKIRPPNVKFEKDLRAAYQEGKREQRGFLSS